IRVLIPDSAIWRICGSRGKLPPAINLLHKRDLKLMQTPKTLRRVVVTGIGCVSPIGIGKEQYWQGIREGRSGTGRITRFDTTDLPVQIAAEVKDFDPDQFIPPKDRQHVSHAVAYAIASAELAFGDAGINPREMALDEKRDIGI